jgi:hypothetical protein
MIWDVHPGSGFFSIPDPGVKKAPDPGPGFATLSKMRDFFPVLARKPREVAAFNTTKIGGSIAPNTRYKSFSKMCLPYKFISAIYLCICHLARRTKPCIKNVVFRRIFILYPLSFPQVLPGTLQAWYSSFQRVQRLEALAHKKNSALFSYP